MSRWSTVSDDVGTLGSWEEPEPSIEDQVLICARAHGTMVAADWFGWSRDRVIKLRRRVDGYDRGRGHPTVEEQAARAPRWDCPCAMCAGSRSAASANLNRKISHLDRAGHLVRMIPAELAAGACRRRPTGWWFPDGIALDNEIPEGMFGGLDPYERADLIQAQAAS